MKRKNTVILMSSIALLIPVLLLSQSLDHLTLLAHYPLINTANDTTGKHDPMILHNTPFQDGGIYCNGNYDGSDFCSAFTPSIDELSFRELAVKTEFKISEYDGERRPVFVCGRFYRWQFVFTDNDSTIGFFTSGDFYSTNSTKTKCTPNEWHIATITYDSLSSEVKLYFDGAAIDSAQFILNHRDDRYFSISHGGSGTAFKGILRNFKIYSTARDTHAAGKKNNQLETFVLAQNYPNPFNPQTVIKYRLPRDSDVEICVYDLLGQEITTLARGHHVAAQYSVTWDGRDNSGQPVSSGVYFYQFKTDDFVAMKKMLLLR